MPKTRTFIDTGVLIAAATGNDAVAARAMTVLDDPGRAFVTSDFVRLEVLPKARYHKNVDEAAFYEAFFDDAEEIIESTGTLVAAAQEEAEAIGLSAVDALHVAAARRGDSDELFTSEKPSKPLFRVAAIRVRTIRPPD